MEYTNWNNLDYLVVQNRSGNQWFFDSIQEFVQYSGTKPSDYKIVKHLNIDNIFEHQSDYKLYDESGLQIPFKVIQQFFEWHTPLPPKQSAWWMKRYRPEHTFRRGSVPGTACWKASSKGYHRSGYSYFAEKRDNVHMFFDEDCIEHGIKPRPKRLGLWSNPWNDFPPSRKGDGWKEYRKHQWKDK